MSRKKSRIGTMHARCAQSTVCEELKCRVGAYNPYSMPGQKANEMEQEGRWQFHGKVENVFNMAKVFPDCGTLNRGLFLLHPLTRIFLRSTCQEEKDHGLIGKPENDALILNNCHS